MSDHKLKQYERLIIKGIDLFRKEQETDSMFKLDFVDFKKPYAHIGHLYMSNLSTGDVVIVFKEERGDCIGSEKTCITSKT